MQQNDSLADGQLPRYRSLCRDLCALSLSEPTLVPLQVGCGTERSRGAQQNHGISVSVLLHLL